MSDVFDGPIRVVAAAEDDGGVTIYFFSKEVLPGGSHARYGSVTSDREGDVTFLLSDRKSGKTEVWGGTPALDVAVAEGMRRIRAFLAEEGAVVKDVTAGAIVPGHDD